LLLLQIPFSHNSGKVRRALALKGLPYEARNVNPMVRRGVRGLSGQRLLPVLVDGDRVVADSTAILLYLEERYPEPPLLPEDSEHRAECLLLEDWADRAFMALTRRIAYWTFLSAGGSLGDLFLPRWPRPLRAVAGALVKPGFKRYFGLSPKRGRRDELAACRLAEVAVARLAGRPYLVGDSLTIADIGLASMSAPLRMSPPAVRGHEAVQALVSWGRTVLGEDYEPERQVVPALERRAAVVSSP
jgi:glutathione S-transferase